MAHNGLKVLDSDMHCMEPRDLWERYIADAYKPFAPPRRPRLAQR